MAYLNLVLITLLSMHCDVCEASAVGGDVSKVTGVADAGEALSTAYYLDIRERMDHLDDKICNTDKHVAEIKEKMSSLEKSVESKIDILGLKLGVEIRDQLAAYTKEMKTNLDRIEETIMRQNDHDQHHRRHHPVVMGDNLTTMGDNLTTTMVSLNEKIMQKLESDVLPLHAATSRLDDKLYALSQKSDVCLRAVLEDRSDNCTEGVTSDLQGAPASAWITIVRRMDGRVNFTRGWDDYKSGFGDLGAEFWLGLEDIHQLTAVRTYRLRVVLTDFSGEVKFAEYSEFFIRGETDNYRLHVTGYVPGSTAGDSLTYHNLMGFTTFDNDNDESGGSNCAASYEGGWWYKSCHYVNPTGLYLGAGSTSTTGINWQKAYNDRRSFKRLEMSIRHNM